MEETRQYSAVSDWLIFAPLLIIAAVIFGRQAALGLTKGVTRFPMSILVIEEISREHTMFWGIVGANIFLSVAALTTGIIILVDYFQ